MVSILIKNGLNIILGPLEHLSSVFSGTGKSDN